MLKKDKTITLTAEVLLEIEDAFNYPLFHGSAVGAMLNDSMCVALYDSQRHWGILRRVKDLFRCYSQQFFKPRRKPIDYQSFSDRIIFTRIADVPHLDRMVLPLLELYDADRYLVVSPYETIATKLPDKTSFLCETNFPTIDMKIWRIEFIFCKKIWLENLRAVIDRYGLPKYLEPFLVSRMQAQTQRLMSAELLVEMLSPKCIVTEFDRNAFSSGLVLGAKKNSIGSISMVHGALKEGPAFGFAPILADIMSCWGRGQIDTFASLGVQSDFLRDTGCHFLKRTLSGEKKAIKEMLGLNYEKPAILLVTSTIKKNEKVAYTNVFCNSIRTLNNVCGFVRHHPAEDKGDYLLETNTFPDVIFLTPGGTTGNDCLMACDIVVAHDTTFVIEALVNRKLVIILDVTETPMGIGEEMVVRAGCPRARNQNELSDTISRLLFDDSYRADIFVQNEAYVQNYCSNFDTAALTEVGKLIDELAH